MQRMSRFVVEVEKFLSFADVKRKYSLIMTHLMSMDGGMKQHRV